MGNPSRSFRIERTDMPGEQAPIVGGQLACPRDHGSAGDAAFQSLLGIGEAGTQRGEVGWRGRQRSGSDAVAAAVVAVAACAALRIVLAGLGTLRLRQRRVRLLGCLQRADEYGERPQLGGRVFVPSGH